MKRSEYRKYGLHARCPRHLYIEIDSYLWVVWYPEWLEPTLLLELGQLLGTEMSTMILSLSSSSSFFKHPYQL